MLAIAASVAAIGATSFSALAQQKTVKVGILHSLSGTMAISETVLKDTVLMAIDEINAKGGVMGAKIEPVVVDPASNWPLFAEKARQLLTQDKVAVVFGCWTSVSRKSVLPVFEELNGRLLPGAVRRRGDLQESCSIPPRPTSGGDPGSRAPMSKDGAAPSAGTARHRLRHPRTTNKILRAFLSSRRRRQRAGHRGRSTRRSATPTTRLSSQHQEILWPAARPRWSPRSTATRSAVTTRELGNQGLKRDRRRSAFWSVRRSCAA
jgi:hypothetical protein